MFPQQASGMNRSVHLPPLIPSNSVQGIPGMPPSAMIPAGGPSAGFALQPGYGGNIPHAPVPSAAINVQQSQDKVWQQSQYHMLPQQEVQNQQIPQQPLQQRDHKHRDYLKQQQRLKAMPLSSSKGMSADALIGNLLEKKDTFTPKQHNQPQGKQTLERTEQYGQVLQMRPAGHPDAMISRGVVSSLNPNDNLPGWLVPTSSRLPPIYSHIWSLVCDPQSGGTLVDTNKILALLLTSGLPKEVLGFIWNIATNGANVQLNQQQLYVTLALVALAQMGCTFNNLSVLNFIPTPPIPSFNMNVPKPGTDEKLNRSDAVGKPSGAFTAAPPPPALSSAAPPPLLLPSVSSRNANQNEEDDFGEEFTDFQSADTSYIPPPSSSNLCASLPSTDVIQPSVTAKQVVSELNHSVVSKISRSHGRSIGSRLANHHLGAPKANNTNQKSRRASVDHDNVCIRDDFGLNIEKAESHRYEQKVYSKHQDSTESEDFSDFQNAAGLDVNVDELFPKCHPKPKREDCMLKESAIRAESDDESLKSKEEELLAFDSLTYTKPPVEDFKSSATQMEISLVVPPPSKSTKELMSTEEDKYSALRFLELDSSGDSVGECGDFTRNTDTDDFGDFVSADDMFAEIAIRDTASFVRPLSLPPNNCLQTLPVQNVEFPVSEWITPVLGSSQPMQEPSLLDNPHPKSNELKTNYDLSSVFSDLNISKGNNDIFKVDSVTPWNFDLEIGKESSTLTLNSHSNNSSPMNEDEFGDFVGPVSTHIDDSHCKPASGFLGDQLWTDNGSCNLMPNTLSDNKSVSSLELPGVTLSRHGSLPSLDLNLFTTPDELGDKTLSSQISDWIRCLESSCSLLQVATSTFTNITSHSVLMEVLGAEEGRNYLNNLLEVHRVAWRIQRSYERSGQESNQMDSILSSVQKVWSTLQTFYKLAGIETAVEKDGSDEESGQTACGVCGSPACRGVLEYGGHVYHAPCANLWLNCVDRTLPAHLPLL